VVRDGGAALADFIAEMRQLDLTELATCKKPLQDGLDALAKASEDLRTLYRTQPAVALAGAMPFLELFGTVTAGWLMARAALASRDGDPDFAKAKHLSAQ